MLCRWQASYLHVIVLKVWQRKVSAVAARCFDLVHADSLDLEARGKRGRGHAKKQEGKENVTEITTTHTIA